MPGFWRMRGGETIVIGGLMFMFGEGGAKRQISGIVFGGGLALFAAQFLTWLF